ncbi:MAG: Glu-tRNA(Gln) amidotransferase subunit GatD [Methanobacteriaceae archaeon]
MSYKKQVQGFLDANNVSIGDKVSASKENLSYEGILLDRSDDADDTHIVLKLASGYNIGVNTHGLKISLIEKGEKPKIEYDELNIVDDYKKATVSIISTGGTVSSIIDYKTGAVHPAFTAKDLLQANPELLDLANIKVKALYNILSENMKVDYWIESANLIYDEINELNSITSNGNVEGNINNNVNDNINTNDDKNDIVTDGGIVVAHGTDTMHYTAAALSFILKSPVPIVITGAQRSSDRPSTDAFLNLMNSVVAAKSDIAGVTVCMHSNLNDGECYLHNGTKVRKMHTSRRDTFRSINTSPIATLENGNIKSIHNHNYIKRGDLKLDINDKMEKKVGFVKSFPGLTAEFIDYLIDSSYKGIVIEGTGLGHVGDHLIKPLKRANDENIPVLMSSQCIYGKVNMDIYSTGRKIAKTGVISAGDMTSETAYVKLSWALGQSENINDVKNIIKTNIAGELGNKSSIANFLN